MSSNEQLGLSDIPGLGPVRRQALAEAGILDLEGLLRTKLVELSAIQGIGQWQARKIWEFLRHRGLLVEGVTELGEPALVVEPHNTAEAEVVAGAIGALEAQAEAVAAVEAEIHELEAAIRQRAGGLEEGEAEVNHGTESAAGTETDEAPGSEQQLDEEPDGGAEDEESEDMSTDDEEIEGEPNLGDRIRSQREQLPEAALALIDAIRQAAVSRQLTRQLTRLLIIAGEFESDTRNVPTEAREHASELLEEADRLIRRALDKQAFDTGRQKDLATRIRKRRKELEAILEEAGGR